MRIEFGEWAPDAPPLENPCNDAKNVIPSSGRYAQFNGLAEISSALPERPLSAIATSVISGETETYAGTANALYRLDGAAWIDCTGSPAPGEVSRWSFCQFGSYVLAASYENELLSVEIGSGDDFATVATNPPKARVLAAVRNFVMAGDILDGTDGDVPWRVRWSAIDESQDWPLPGTNDAYAKQADEQDLRAEDGAVQAIVGGEFGLIFQEKAITRATYVGSPIVFQMDRIDSTRGAISPGSVINVGRLCYFLARDGFFVTDGAGDSVSIGHGKVDRWLLDQLDDNSLQYIVGTADPRRKIIFWAFPTSGGSVPNRLIIYNYEERRWSYADLDLTGVVLGRLPGYTLEEVDDFESDLDVLAIPLDDPFWGPGGRFLAGFDSQYRLATFSGDALEATIATGSFGLEGERGFLSGVRPLVTGSTGVTISVGTRDLLGEDATYTGFRSITQSTGIADFRATGFFFNVKLRIASGGFDTAHGIDAIVIADDARR